MSTHPIANSAVRSGILADPAALLDDPEIRSALVRAEDAERGRNVIDLRSAAMGRLEARLERLEDTHRSVIAAAYENLSGMGVIHRAALMTLEATDMEGLLDTLAGPVAETLRLDGLRLVLETGSRAEAQALRHLPDVLGIAEPGFAAGYAGIGDGTAMGVVLREADGDGQDLYPGSPVEIRSEACLLLDAGPTPGLLAMGAGDPAQFAPGQGTDLLSFYAGVLSRTVARLRPEIPAPQAV